RYGQVAPWVNIASWAVKQAWNWFPFWVNVRHSVSWPPQSASTRHMRVCPFMPLSMGTQSFGPLVQLLDVGPFMENGTQHGLPLQSLGSSQASIPPPSGQDAMQANVLALKQQRIPFAHC